MTLSNETRQSICQAVQEILDDWQQDEEGVDAELGTGGCCDRVAAAIASELSQLGYDTLEGGQDGDDHCWVIVVADDESCWDVDIDPDIYETGSGYCWKKRPGVVIQPQHIQCEKCYTPKGKQ